MVQTNRRNGSPDAVQPDTSDATHQVLARRNTDFAEGLLGGSRRRSDSLLFDFDSPVGGSSQASRGGHQVFSEARDQLLDPLLC